MSDSLKLLIEIDAKINDALKGIDGLNDRLEDGRKKTESWSDKLFSFNQAWEAMSHAAALAGSALQAGLSVADSFIETGSKFEQIGVRFKTVFGEASDAATKWATEFGAKTPLTLEEVSNQMIKLKTYGFDPMDGTMQKLGDAAYALGTDFDGIATALGQMQMKGKVSGEELMQLAERNIPAAKILQEHFGLTAKQMENMSTAGIDVNEAIKVIVDTVGTKYAGAMERASSTWSGSWSTIEDTWELIKKQILDSGPWDWLVSRVNDFKNAFSEIVEDEGFQTWLTTIGEGVTGFLDAGYDTLRAFYEAFGENFSQLGEYLASFFDGGLGNGKQFFQSLVDGIFWVEEAFGAAWNAIIDTIQALNFGNWFGQIMSGIGNLLGWIVEGTVNVMSMLVKQVGDGFESIMTMIEGVVLNFPSIAESLGINASTFDEVRSFNQGLKEVVDTAQAGASAFNEKFIGGAADFFGNMNQNLEGWKFNVEGMEEKHQAVNSALAKISYEPVKTETAKVFKELPELAETSSKKASETVQKNFQQAAEKSKESFKDLSNNIDTNLNASMTETDKALSSYMEQMNASDSWSDQQEAKNKSREVLDMRIESEKTLAKVLEKLLDPGARKLNLSVKIDSAEDAITALVKRVIEEITLQAEAEGTLVAGS